MTGSLNRPRLILIAVLCLAAVPYFTRLGASSLWDSNEAFYTETPREMIESGDLINPSFNYQPRFNKPPLSYWIVAGFYKLFGVSEASERLAIAMAALALIATAFGLGRLLFSVEAGLYSAIALAIAPRFMMFSRRIMIDVTMAMFMAAALFFFALAESRPERRRHYLLLMYVALGLGVMTKGPVGIALPALVFLIYFALHRELRRLREMMLPLGALVVAAIVLPWYGAIYAQHNGWQYIATFILKDNLSRYTQPVWGPRRNLFFYGPVIIGDMFPGSLFMLGLLFITAFQWLRTASVLRHLRRKRAVTTEPVSRPSIERTATSDAARVQRLCLIWVAVIVAFFSLSQNKEDLYILPIYPAVAALAGVFLARAVEAGAASLQIGWARWTGVLAGLLIAAAGGGVIYLFAHSAADYQFAGARAAGYITLGGGLLTIAMAWRKQLLPTFLAMALTVIAFNWVFLWRTLPDFERFKPVRPLCEQIQAIAPTDALVGYYRIASPSMVFYLRRQIFEYYNPEELLRVFAADQPVYCLIRAEEYEAIKQQLPPDTSVLASRPLFQVKLMSILNKKEPPQLLLITNKGGAEFGR